MGGIFGGLIGMSGPPLIMYMKQAYRKDFFRTQLIVATKDLFGAARMEATDVIAVLKRGNKDEMVTLPKLTAYDLLDEITPDQMSIPVGTWRKNQ